MEFKEEHITEITGLEPAAQITKLNELTNAHEATLKKDWDGKANTDAEAILQGAADSVETLTGIKREQGVKIKDYFTIAGESYAKGAKQSYDNKVIELDKKIKEGSTDPLVKKELEDTKLKLDALQQKEALFTDWEKNDWKGKFETADQELSSYKLNASFNAIKPTFPDTANVYEANGRWNEFVVKTKAEYIINEDGTVVSRENKHVTTTLKALLEKDTALSDFAKGRQATGMETGAKAKVKIEGVPFDVPKNATASERTKAIQEYITGDLKISRMAPEYAPKFAEYNKILLEKNPHK